MKKAMEDYLLVLNSKKNHSEIGDIRELVPVGPSRPSSCACPASLAGNQAEIHVMFDI